MREVPHSNSCHCPACELERAEPHLNAQSYNTKTCRVVVAEIELGENSGVWRVHYVCTSTHPKYPSETWAWMPLRVWNQCVIDWTPGTGRKWQEAFGGN